MRMISVTKVYIRNPSQKCSIIISKTLLNLPHSMIQGMGRPTTVQSLGPLLHEQILVKLCCKLWPMHIRNISHCTDHSTITSSKHASSKMHNFLWQVNISFACLACWKEGQARVWYLLLHNFKKLKATIMEMDTTLQRLTHILDSMARKVNPIVSLHFCLHFVCGSLNTFQQQDIDAKSTYQCFDIMCFLLSWGYGWKTWGVWLADEKKARTFRRGGRGLEFLFKGVNSWCVWWNHKIRDALSWLICWVINPSCMKWKKHKKASWAPPYMTMIWRIGTRLRSVNSVQINLMINRTYWVP